MVEVWKADSPEGLCTDAHMVNMKDVSALRVMTGKSLKGIFPKVTLILESEFPPADFFRSGSLYFIVSEPFKELLEIHANVQVEFYELELRQRGRIYNDKRYYFGNIMTQVDCFDRVNGLFTPQGELVNNIKRLAINESKAGTHKLFRIEKLMCLVICVQESLASIIRDSGFSGVKFIRPSDWKL